jgi:hypothetical protein
MGRLSERGEKMRMQAVESLITNSMIRIFTIGPVDLTPDMLTNEIRVLAKLIVNLTDPEKYTDEALRDLESQVVTSDFLSHLRGVQS